MKHILHKTKGSIALITVLVVSIFTLILAVGITETSISTGYQYLNNESENYSYYSAEGCIEEALLRMEQDSSFTGTTVVFDNGSCTVTVTGTNPKTVSIELVSGDYVQNFVSEVAISENGHAINTSLSSWEEI